MAKHHLSDSEAKAILKKWHRRTKSYWPAPGGHGYWVRAQPKGGKRAGPRLHAPGATLFKTQPDGLWLHVQVDDFEYADAVVIESCGSSQNLNDKRSRYFPSSHSLVVEMPLAWLKEEFSYKGKTIAHWRAFSTFTEEPEDDLVIPVRHLRVLYAIPNTLYKTWAPEHVPTGYEFFCPHSSLDSHSNQHFREFLGQMSIASQFYAKR